MARPVLICRYSSGLGHRAFLQQIAVPEVSFSASGTPALVRSMVSSINIARDDT